LLYINGILDSVNSNFFEYFSFGLTNLTGNLYRKSFSWASSNSLNPHQSRLNFKVVRQFAIVHYFGSSLHSLYHRLKIMKESKIQNISFFRKPKAFKKSRCFSLLFKGFTSKLPYKLRLFIISVLFKPVFSKRISSGLKQTCFFLKFLGQISPFFGLFLGKIFPLIGNKVTVQRTFYILRLDWKTWNHQKLKQDLKASLTIVTSTGVYSIWLLVQRSGKAVLKIIFIYIENLCFLD